MVYTCPIWLYCDDTSGNVSKKWNKHNSILFVFAGLPRENAQQLYNVHFLATSNLASPLEMMEEVNRVLQCGRANGFEVWDCLSGENALVIPWVLAFQGDNPMSSEFASHIGMAGRCICRVCRKPEVADAAPEEERILDFLTAGEPRSKEQTLRDLDEQHQRVMGGAPSAIDAMGTATGTKDKYYQHFVDLIQAKVNKWREDHKNVPAREGSSKKAMEREMLEELRRTLPDNLFNPVLQIPDFDANQDSPVEILHVVLLGVVKYWWRDAVSRQNTEGKAKLKARLSSFDVTGLGISALAGHTLVQYAGSLVGRDFRVILQVAPAVLYGMIPEEAYEAWLALCKLAPLIFQPVIDNLQNYEVRPLHSSSQYIEEHHSPCCTGDASRSHN
ncbi:hypothetical protein C8T65DRAFT_756256 [Cerioporus squamosus]|nr:hypothetical protein C8T65DRAFT_756256 [Cerioporus squamosus]